MNQTEQIHNYLKEGNAITAIEALNLFKCFRLAARISDLKRQGVNISSEMITTDTQKRVMRYSLSISEKKLFCKSNQIKRTPEHGC
mgnify:CR=1 FL=1